jgi:predicted PurR-regulated permease PerM
MTPDEQRPMVAGAQEAPEDGNARAKRWSYATFALLILATIAFLRFAQPFLLPFVLAVLLHFLLRPLVLYLEQMRLPRPLGAAVVLIVFLAALGFALSSLQAPAKAWLSKVPESVRKLEEDFRNLGSRVVPRFNPEQHLEVPSPASDNPPASEPRQTPWLTRLQDALLSFTALTQTASFLSTCLETIVLLFFLLASGDALLRRLVQVLPKQKAKDEAVAIVHEVQHSVSAYLITTVVINVCVGLVVALAMRLLGLESPLLWGVLAAVLNFLPYFGPFTVFLILLLAGSFSFDQATRSFLPGVVYLGIHAVESNIITPTALGNRLTLSPLIIFLALMFWTWLWGIPGALLAVPLLMVFRILCEHVKSFRWLGELLGG